MNSRDRSLYLGYSSAVLLLVGWMTVLFRIQPFTGGSEKIGIDGLIEDFVAGVLEFASPSGGVSEFSLLGGIAAVAKDGHVPLAGLLFFVSVVFPIAKLGIAIYAVHTTGHLTPKKEHWLKILGPWSLLDVVVVSLLVITAKGLPFGTLITPGVGFYAFALSIVLAWLCTFLAPTQ